MLLLPFVLPAQVETQAPESLRVLLERARTARDEGRLQEAIQAYEAMLTQVPDHETALLERGETFGWAGRYEEARAAYQQFRNRFPAQALTADLALAKLAAWQDHTSEALDILEPWIKQEKRRAMLDAAIYLSWSGRLPESLSRIRRWRLAHPDDLEATLLEARMFTWAGREAEAREAFTAILKDAPEDREALAGLARLALWEGDVETTRRFLARIPTEAMAHPDSQLLLAQTESAEGATRSARRRADLLARGGSTQRDAEELREEIIANQGPWVELAMERTDTSEGLRTEKPALQARVPLGDGALTLGVSSPRTDFQSALQHPSQTSLGLTYPLGPSVSASATVQRLSNVGGEAATGYALGLSYRPLAGLDLSLSHERSLALYTPQSGTLRTVIQATDLGGTWRFGQGRHAFSGGLGQADIESSLSGQSSIRSSHMAAYEYRFPVSALDLRGGFLHRDFGYSHTLPLGFFNPEQYQWRGAFGSATWHQGRRLELSLGAQAGQQEVNGGATQFSWTYRAGATWRPSRVPLDLSLWWNQSRAGLPVIAPIDASAYREHTLGFSIRLHSHASFW